MQVPPNDGENVSRLALAHPALFENRVPLYSDLPTGWYALVDRLCSSIERELGPEIVKRVSVVQIKEKWGTLRFYTYLDDHHDIHVDVVSSAGVQGFIVESEVDDPEAPAVTLAWARLRELTEAAEAASATLCQECGEPGSLRRLSWIRTLCDAHYFLAKTPRAPDADTEPS